MKSHTLKTTALLTILVMLLGACQSILPTSANLDLDSTANEDSPTSTNTQRAADPSPTPGRETPSPEPTQEPTMPEPGSETEEAPAETEDKPQEASTAEPPQTVGPEVFPAGINPLTGLPAANPAFLELPPALISISNFPASARPQAGLNSSPITFELAIGEGMTRFLAMFYGGYPQAVSGQSEGAPAGGAQSESASGSNPDDADSSGQESVTAPASIGPIRSGRLPYEDVRSLYTGFLVMASAWEGVTTNLSETTSVYGNNEDDINSALVGVDKLEQIAQSQAEGYPGSNFNLTGLKFTQNPPEGGQAAHQLWVFYSMLNQIQWHYDQALGAYIRYDIKTDGSGAFVMATDRLSGEPLSKENVVVVYAEHDYKAPTLIDIDLINRPPSKALLFRDGEVHKIFWTTQFGDYEKETGLMRPMRFVDTNGDPVPLKHGQTWVHIVSTASYYRESAISDHPFHPVIEEGGTGLWVVRYKGKY